MAILGTYLTLEIDGEVIAETVNVNLKMKGKPLDGTSQSSGIASTYSGGALSVAIGGKYLMATTGANWDTLWASFRAGTEISVALYRSGVALLTGFGIIAKLNQNGKDSKDKVTGGFALRYYPETTLESITVDSTVITVDSTTITADRI